VRGRTVVRDGALVGDQRTGQHVARERSPYAAAAGGASRA
jgi:hypothetical protein